jgi:hypothetical protein
MMGRLKSEQGQLFYQFNLEDAVPVDHLVRRIDAALDLSWLRDELAPHYSSMGRPSIDPELMIRMLVVGYVFAIRSERKNSANIFLLADAEAQQTIGPLHDRLVREFFHKIEGITGHYRKIPECILVAGPKSDLEF